jgi:hypothetical protein
MENGSTAPQLRGFFRDSVRQSFWQLGIHDATVAEYVADVLTEFARTENLYKIHTNNCRKVDTVVEMLTEEQSASAAESDLLRERSRRKYVGDYALFMSGIFRKHIEGRGSLDYYLQEGSRSYWKVSELDLSLYHTGYYLFQELSKKFEYYSGALDYVRMACFAAAPGEDSCAGFLRRIEGWMTVNLTEN